MRDLEKDGIIDSETAQQIMKSKKERILKKYPLLQATAGYWYVNVRFAPGPNGKKMLKRAKKEDLEKYLIEFVGEQGLDAEFKRRNRKNYSYKKCFDNWLNAQQYKVKSTESRNQREYKRFFEKIEEGKEFAEKDIRTITASQIEQMMTLAIQTHNLTARKAVEDYNMFFEIVFQQAIADGLIKPDANPCLFVIKNRFLQYGRAELDVGADERIIDPETMAALYKLVQKDHERKEDYMPPYAFELAALTGMRCGELGGLMWKNIDFEKRIIHIVQSQKFDEVTRTYYISDTKNRKKRWLPITDDIMDVLVRIQTVQEKYGKTEDYVFSNAKGFSSNRQIGDYLQNKKVQLKTDKPLSIHAERRTLNSKMAAQGVSETVRAALLGHTPRINRTNYTYDMMLMDEKKAVLESAGKRA